MDDAAQSRRTSPNGCRRARKAWPRRGKSAGSYQPERHSPDEDEDDNLVERSTMEFIDSLPKPLAVILRTLLFIIGIGGYLGFTIVRLAMLPLVFGLVGAFSSAKFKPKLKESRKTVSHAIDDCRGGFKVITGMSRKPKPLNPDRQEKQLAGSQTRRLIKTSRSTGTLSHGGVGNHEPPS